MPAPPRPARRHARRNSVQRQPGPHQPAASQRWEGWPQQRRTPPAPRRRNLYQPPASLTTRHAQVRHLHEELHDLTKNVADVQRRIEELETDEHSAELNDDDADDVDDDDEDDLSHDHASLISPARASPSRAPSTAYRLPELSLDSATDFARFHLDDFLHASRPASPTPSSFPVSLVHDTDELPTPLARATLEASNDRTAAQRNSHHRDESAATLRSFASYNTEAVQVCEASTAAILRPYVRNIAQRRNGRSSTREEETQADAQRQLLNNDDDRANRVPQTSSPSRLSERRQYELHPRRISSLPQPCSRPVAPRDSKILRQPRPVSWLARDSDDQTAECMNWRPVSCATRLESDGQAEPVSTPSSEWATESNVSEATPCQTDSYPEHGWQSSSQAATREEFSTPLSAQPPRWLHSSPPPSEEPRLDSSCTSFTDSSSPTHALSKPPTRLNIFPRIQQSSQESLRPRCESESPEDPFYAVCQDQSGFREWSSSPSPIQPEMAEVTKATSTKPGQELSIGSNDHVQRKDHRLRGFLSPGVKRQRRETGAKITLVRSPRRKLRTFLRRFTPTTNKIRHSMPSGPISSLRSPDNSETVAWQPPTTPPRLPTRRGSTLPFDESLLGELTKISARRDASTGAAPSPVRRIRNSMHDAAGLTLSKTAATHAHWRAQRSRSSILSSVHPRSRAPTTSTMRCSLSSGPSFYFLPKVDQIPVTPSSRVPLHQRRLSRY